MRRVYNPSTDPHQAQPLEHSAMPPSCSSLTGLRGLIAPGQVSVKHKTNLEQSFQNSNSKNNDLKNPSNEIITACTLSFKVFSPSKFRHCCHSFSVSCCNQQHHKLNQMQVIGLQINTITDYLSPNFFFFFFSKLILQFLHADFLQTDISFYS